MADESLKELLSNARRARKALVKAQDDLTASESMYVQAARNRNLTWQEIGDNLGMTHQGAWEKYRLAAVAVNAPRRVNMDDVATEAGVTRRTVARFFSEPHLVSDETNQAIVKAMAKLGYERPNDGRRPANKSVKAVG